jgi:hypothetical protein
VTEYIVRPFRGEEDIEAVVGLRVAAETDRPSGFPASRARLRNVYLRPRPGWSRDISLWELEGRLHGLADLRISDDAPDVPIAYLRFYAHPDRELDAL